MSSAERDALRIIEMTVGEDGTDEFMGRILDAVKVYLHSTQNDRGEKLEAAIAEIHESAIITYGQIQEQISEMERDAS